MFFRPLVNVTVNAPACTGCSDCWAACPHGALSMRKGKATIKTSACTRCLKCMEACPEGAIEVVAADPGPGPRAGGGRRSSVDPPEAAEIKPGRELN